MATGPIPKRSEERVRRNTPDVPVDKITVLGNVSIPDLGMPRCHPLVHDLYESMRQSAQSRWYEPSDWQFARLAMHVLNDYLQEGGPISAMKLASINTMLTSLLLTEGERRRVRIEVERNQAAGEVIDIQTLFENRLRQK
jgi:hypothetical protein